MKSDILISIMPPIHMIFLYVDYMPFVYKDHYVHYWNGMVIRKFQLQRPATSPCVKPKYAKHRYVWCQDNLLEHSKTHSAYHYYVWPNLKLKWLIHNFDVIMIIRQTATTRTTIKKEMGKNSSIYCIKNNWGNRLNPRHIVNRIFMTNIVCSLLSDRSA